MNKRLLKRHKRQVSRAKERIRLSEPDVRPPEQVRAARQASRAATDRRTGAHPLAAGTRARRIDCIGPGLRCRPRW
jgi:hypothetical protein